MAQARQLEDKRHCAPVRRAVHRSQTAQSAGSGENSRSPARPNRAAIAGGIGGGPVRVADTWRVHCGRHQLLARLAAEPGAAGEDDGQIFTSDIVPNRGRRRDAAGRPASPANNDHHPSGRPRRHPSPANSVAGFLERPGPAGLCPRLSPGIRRRNRLYLKQLRLHQCPASRQSQRTRSGLPPVRRHISLSMAASAPLFRPRDTFGYHLGTSARSLARRRLGPVGRRQRPAGCHLAGFFQRRRRCPAASGWARAQWRRPSARGGGRICSQKRPTADHNSPSGRRQRPAARRSTPAGGRRAVRGPPPPGTQTATGSAPVRRAVRPPPVTSPETEA